MDITTLSIDRRFAGPPFAANGGYVVGLLAEHLGIRHASVDLIAPAPLDRPIEIEVGEGMGTARYLGTEIARVYEACPVPPRLAPSDFVSAAMASGDADPADHPFPNCFVCGPSRETGDGLHLLAGRTPTGEYAVPWVPAAWQADPTGTVGVRMVAAALDCPSAFPIWQTDAPALLANMTFQIDRLPRVGEHLVVTSDGDPGPGRKLPSATVIHDSHGEQVAVARTLWIRLTAGQLESLAEMAA